jgi:hypothetical protein
MSEPTSEASRRFTDREVALVLKKASEIEEAQARDGARGLSLEDLQEIAREVGISAESVEAAVSFAPAPLVRQAVHAVEGELGREALARLIGVVDERVSGAGSVAEALGTVRWTGRSRFKSTQVSLTPRAGERMIQVVEKTEPHLASVIQIVPGAWGGIIGLAVASPLGLGGLGIAAAVVGGVAVGVTAGRLAWARVSEGSRARGAPRRGARADSARHGHTGPRTRGSPSDPLDSRHAQASARARRRPLRSVRHRA